MPLPPTHRFNPCLLFLCLIPPPQPRPPPRTTTHPHEHTHSVATFTYHAGLGQVQLAILVHRHIVVRGVDLQVIQVRHVLLFGGSSRVRSGLDGLADLEQQRNHLRREAAHAVVDVDGLGEGNLVEGLHGAVHARHELALARLGEVVVLVQVLLALGCAQHRVHSHEAKVGLHIPVLRVHLLQPRLRETEVAHGLVDLAGLLLVLRLERVIAHLLQPLVRLLRLVVRHVDLIRLLVVLHGLVQLARGLIPLGAGVGVGVRWGFRVLGCRLRARGESEATYISAIMEVSRPAWLKRPCPR
mmetsp:Transcript_43823/g.137665  ORF Transcript_43823/g.137665 Transcript_43823/m.137665 type:complete len:299 (+) Transcript_43823:860-1756(+)